MDGTVTDPEALDLGGYPGSEDDLLAKFGKWDQALDSHWSEWRQEAKDHYELYAGRQWSTAEEEAMKDAKRPPVTMNRTATVIDAVSGAEIMGRQKAAYYPREVGDGAVNEILTSGAEWVRDQTDGDFEESEAIRDAFICGMGWTETRMDYEEELSGKILIGRTDPLEMAADPSHRKPGCADARYLRRRKPVPLDDFERLFPGKTATSDQDTIRSRSSDHKNRYRDGDVEASRGDDEVTVCEWQWFDVATRHVVSDPNAPEGLREVAAGELDALRSGGVRVVPVPRRTYWRAFTAAEQVLRVEELPDGEFTYKCITGKRDRNKGTWFGLMRLMKDPQRWANSFFSQILHIINSTAKGGVMAEADAIDDVRKFEESIARHDVVTWMPPGSLSMGKVQPKPMAPYPQGLDRLMEIAVSSIRDVTGVNQELLGLANRDQPGVLEDQRKQAAYGVLASFFDSVRRYRKAQGRLMLKLMRYLPPGFLVRLVGADGVGKYVPLSQQPETAKFDVIVDEAPAGPQQKERVWNMALQMTPILKDLGPEEWGVLLEYSPFPSAVVQKMKEVLQKKAEAVAQPDPAAEAMKAAGVEKAQGDAALAKAKAAKTGAEATQAQAEADRMAAFAQMFSGSPIMSGGPAAL